VTSVEQLRGEVLERYASIHAFCREHAELKRATVYMVLSGRYPGRVETQIAKIRAALMSVPGRKAESVMPGMTREETVEALQNIRCAHCRRLDRRGCHDCRRQTEREARDLYTRLFPGGSRCDVGSYG